MLILVMSNLFHSYSWMVLIVVVRLSISGKEGCFNTIVFAVVTLAVARVLNLC